MFRCESHLRQSQKVFENEFEFITTYRSVHN